MSATSPAQIVAMFKDYEKIGTVTEFYEFVYQVGEVMGMGKGKATVAATLTYPMEIAIVATAGARLPEQFDDQVIEGMEALGRVIGNRERSEHLTKVYLSREVRKFTNEKRKDGSDAYGSASEQEALSMKRQKMPLVPGTMVLLEKRIAEFRS
jgi:hypothetical protein